MMTIDFPVKAQQAIFAIDRGMRHDLWQEKSTTGISGDGSRPVQTCRIGVPSAPLDNFRFLFYFGVMAETATPDVQTGTVQEAEEKPKSTLEPGFLVVCWNDPVNFMDYVTHVFQIVFGWQRKKAGFHMLQVHEQGKSVLTRDSMEKAEHYVHQLQKYSLHATMERDE